ncbi:glycoside hydrolase family 3 protein [Sphingomonas sp. So64.6b]|uniref:beta-glucosidase n=1 Tax=Sphingomonas sp. So64.6b TaxID=2997354 RepID=UPI001600C0A9|nr:glycoside hydrolase family 3 protein [Sphingomonas sp. So64.6b]QNA86142.1 glycoside hydrolase family 3 protein [Sphingomonas sp. So64.6b]
MAIFRFSSRAALLAACALSALPATAEDRVLYLNPAAPLEARVDDLLSRLTLEEKISLMAGATGMTGQAIPRLGIPEIKMTDGPTGVRSPEGQPATVFPVGVAIAATWNPALAQQVGGAIAEEARGYGASVLLAPTVNIVRTPRWGRNFETYSEDPYLTGRIALGYVRGVQDNGVGVSIKHFAANNQETNRFFTNSVVDERTMRELYLPAFETVVKTLDPWSVMASYNKLNGTYAGENSWLLTDVLKKEWGFKGFVVSDWGATHTTAKAINAGLDLEMPGPPQHFGAKLLAAAKAGEVTPAQIDETARRMVRLIVRSGVIEGTAGTKGMVGGPAHAAVSQRAAEEAIVLLKNAGLLPLDPSIRTLAVIGPNAAKARIQGGGSSAVQPFDAIAAPLDALRAALPGVKILYERGVDSEDVPPAADAALFSMDGNRTRAGLAQSYFAAADQAGEPVASDVATTFVKYISGNVAGPQSANYLSLRWKGLFWAPVSGRYEFSIRGTGKAMLAFDGKTLIDKTMPSVPDNRDVIGFPVARRTATVELEAGKGYPIQLDYTNGKSLYESLSFGVRVPRPSLDAAVAAAKSADAAIVIVGSNSLTEGEGYDRASIDLPGDQDKLVSAIAAANKKTVVVVNAGAAMTMPWKDEVPAIVDMWLTGQSGPAALAGILTGKVNPSGRLPVTFPARDADDVIKMDAGTSSYSEGLLVGYRSFDARGVTPLFAFGHGLSYTSFDYGKAVAPARIKAGAATKVMLEVRNTGKRDGMEVVQLYVAPVDRAATEPVKQLRAFAKVAIPAGSRQSVVLTLDPRAFATYDVVAKAWMVRPGRYRLMIGAASDDIRTVKDIEVSGTARVP